MQLGQTESAAEGEFREDVDVGLTDHVERTDSMPQLPVGDRTPRLRRVVVISRQGVRRACTNTSNTLRYTLYSELDTSKSIHGSGRTDHKILHLVWVGLGQDTLDELI